MKTLQSFFLVMLVLLACHVSLLFWVAWLVIMLIDLVITFLDYRVDKRNAQLDEAMRKEIIRHIDLTHRAIDLSNENQKYFLETLQKIFLVVQKK